jgi:hypothetical protein
MPKHIEERGAEQAGVSFFSSHRRAGSSFSSHRQAGATATCDHDGDALARGGPSVREQREGRARRSRGQHVRVVQTWHT